MNDLASPSIDVKPAASLRRQRWLLAGALALLLTSLYFIWTHFQTHGIAYDTGDKRPLLKSEGADFHDAQTGVRFTPPPKWSMQARSYQAPDHKPKDRLIVKFKRTLPNTSAAWLRVEIAEMAADTDIVEVVKQRKAGHEWTTKSAVATTKVSGLPAAKIQLGGKYNEMPALRDVVGVRRGDQVIFFAGTYAVGDRLAHEQFLQTLQTCVIEPR